MTANATPARRRATRSARSARTERPHDSAWKRQTRIADPDESMTASLKVDDELGATAVCISANHPSASAHLDAVASWALGVCMVEELLRASRRELSR